MLDLSKPSQLRHLCDDAQAAEDLAIRYADSHNGPSGARGEYGRALGKCMAGLFEAIGKNHGVTPEQVRRSVFVRRTGPDLAVVLSFAVLYGFAASVVARRISRRFPPPEGRGVVLTAIASAIIGAAGLLLGEVWSTTAENLRVGNGHLSYRVDRIPWVQHRLGFFVVCVVLFWLLAALEYWLAAAALKRRALKLTATS